MDAGTDLGVARIGRALPDPYREPEPKRIMKPIGYDTCLTAGDAPRPDYPSQQATGPPPIEVAREATLVTYSPRRPRGRQGHSRSTETSRKGRRIQELSPGGDQVPPGDKGFMIQSKAGASAALRRNAGGPGQGVVDLPTAVVRPGGSI